MAKLKTRDQLKNAGIDLWNERCMKLIDEAESSGLRLMDEGKDTESIVGMDLAIDLLLEKQSIAALDAEKAKLMRTRVPSEEFEQIRFERDESRRTQEYWKAEHLAANTENAALKEQLAEARKLAQWTPITPETMPKKSGDDFYVAILTDSHMSATNRLSPYDVVSGWYLNTMPQLYTHFRPIAPPQEAPR